jgi:hypothetical protein
MKKKEISDDFVQYIYFSRLSLEPKENWNWNRFPFLIRKEALKEIDEEGEDLIK